MEAVRTNILGAFNVAKAAREHTVAKCIFLSTDKAVYPINAMGQSKALMEKVMSSFAVEDVNSHTIFCATRYGNVMNSRGSVIPLFISQIQDRSPVTITNPEMTRFLMSLDQAVELVLEALCTAESGDIYVLKSPACTVGDLARVLMSNFNYDGTPIIIGTRMGEKLFETLVSAEELTRAYETEKHFVIKANRDELTYEKYLYTGKLKAVMNDDYTSHNTQRLNIIEINNTLKSAGIID
jgi:UDP-glucose 4-epimerase